MRWNDLGAWKIEKVSMKFGKKQKYLYLRTQNF